MQNLLIKRVSNSNSCPRCNQSIEYNTHVGRDCPYARKIWRLLDIQWSNDASNLCFEEWLLWLFKAHYKGKHVSIVTTIWSLWFARNRFIYEHQYQSEESVVTFVRSHCMEIKYVSSSLLHPHTHVLVRWKPPLEPTAKVNFDACFSYTQKKSCSGFIIRDSVGYVPGSSFIHNERITSVFMAEAIAILQGVEFAKDLRITRITLESDSKKIIQKLNENTSYIGHIIRDAEIVTGQAHAMALEGSRAGFDQFWIEEAPEKALQAADDDRRSIDPP
ncbi:uncharacterized protein LOC120128636 [Hibiscus syriacus]|uniref:uncharacterized protein LOC120128636 n=1 Tax=Hibiscus syriacus TaxID=106335 RepID=UPI001924FEDF|nr:uncharacterized protein LOC120128636 [Hibiscus syriacus]